MQTIPGAVMSLVSYTVLLWYFILLLIEIQQDQYTLKQSRNETDVTKVGINLDKSNFDTAFMIRSPILKQNATSNIYQYLSFKATYIAEGFESSGQSVTQQFQEQSLNVDECSSTRMFGNQQYLNYRLSRPDAIFICFNELQDFQLQSSENTIQFTIDKCIQSQLDLKYPGSICEKDSNKIQAFINNTRLIAFTTQQFFDISSFEERPVRDKIQTENYTFSSSQQTVANYELMLNQGTGSNSKLHENLDTFDVSYIYTKLVSTDVQNRRTGDADYFTFKFYVMTELNQVERIANNLVTALSNVGGLAGIIFSFVALLISPLQEFIFYQYLLKKNYLVERSKVQQQQHSSIDNFQQKQQQQIIDDSVDKMKSKMTQEDFRTYMQLTKVIKDRQPFSISTIQAIRYKLKFLFCCCRKRYQSYQFELFEFGKSKIERQFDISIILRDMRSFKMANNLVLSKFQRQLIPYFKKSLLNQKYANDQARQNKENESDLSRSIQQRKLRNELLDDVSQLMLDLFAHQQGPNSQFNNKVLDSLFSEDKYDQNQNLRMKMFRGLLRQFFISNLEFDERQVKKGGNAVYAINDGPMSFGIPMDDQQVYSQTNIYNQSRAQLAVEDMNLESEPKQATINYIPRIN
ncbi:UNKNOWN [Stylonychia lemnae]|uniref:Uncharacterized protein n=1 Tax=Stylonychia lemnae TaxID=5949 RepID=A0A078AY69_STYLE|nr:UNKNOWN [Stylonychia lemnae]|eukprot:CDW87114.1 UNKNOWN [Stylonychia lemnae]